jgi:tRNA ligase
MGVNEGLEEALARAVHGVVDLLGLPPPSDEDMGKALRAARNYTPGSKVPKKGDHKKKKETPIRYYGILPEMDLEEVIGSVMNSNTVIPDSARELWEQLKANQRLTARPHVTIVHMKELERERPVWKACEELLERSPPLFELKLGHLVWNDRVMALTVDDLTFNAEDSAAEAATKFLTDLSDNVKRRLHITVGTKDPSIPPVEAKELVEEYRSGAQVNTVVLDYGVVRGRVKGLIG